MLLIVFVAFLRVFLARVVLSMSFSLLRFRAGRSGGSVSFWVTRGKCAHAMIPVRSLLLLWECGYYRRTLLASPFAVFGLGACFAARCFWVWFRGGFRSFSTFSLLWSGWRALVIEGFSLFELIMESCFRKNDGFHFYVLDSLDLLSLMAARISVSLETSLVALIVQLYTCHIQSISECLEASVICVG